MTRLLAVFRQVLPILVALTLVVASQASPQNADATPSLQAILNSVARYLAGYERDILAIVAEEDYSQHFAAPVSGAGGAVRRLKSEILVLSDPQMGTVTFRDVYEVDGKPVRDRDERLARLFAKTSTNAAQEARAVSDESARFNLNISGVSTNRTLNVPMAALLYYRGPFQHRSRFALERIVVERNRRLAIVAFAEQSLPRLISSPNNLAMSGRAWIEINTGRVLETELTYTLTSRAGKTEAKIAVEYVEDAMSKLLMPVTMKETYAVGLAGVMTTTARYSKFRRFSVEAETAFTSSAGSTAP